MRYPHQGHASLLERLEKFELADRDDDIAGKMDVRLVQMIQRPPVPESDQEDSGTYGRQVD